MADKQDELIKALENQRLQSIKDFARVLMLFVPLSRNLKPDEQAEYERISRAVEELSVNYQQTLREIEPLARESATPEQQREYLLRMTALLEHHTETIAQLTKGFSRLLFKVIAESDK